MATTKSAPRFDCMKCPGYCCSYPRIEVKDDDVTRLAEHFGVDFATAQRRFTRIYEFEGERERVLRHRKDSVYQTICRFFDQRERRCTIYTARPDVCRDYPNGRRCGYFEFIEFERKHQDDPEFIPSA